MNIGETGLVTLDWRSYRNIVFLTGAGISTAAGLPTFRGPDGLWNDDDLARLSHGSTLRAEPGTVWRFYAARRRLASAAEPTQAHRTLATLEAEVAPGRTVTVLTTNVDGLHLRAGSRRVIEFHGAFRRVRCLDFDCPQPSFDADGLPEDTLPLCPTCGGPLRPDVVLFGETIPPRVSADALKALAACDLFVAVGTSGTVWPAAGFARNVALRGGRTVSVNLAAPDPDHGFTEAWVGPAEALVPGLFGEGVDPGFRINLPGPEELQGDES